MSINLARPWKRNTFLSLRVVLVLRNPRNTNPSFRRGARALLFKAYNTAEIKAHFHFGVKNNSTREKECLVFHLNERQALGIPATFMEAKVCRHPRTGTGWGVLGGSMETGDASGLAPGAPAAGSGLGALRGSPGTCLPRRAGQAEIGGPGHRHGRGPRVHLEGTKAVKARAPSASAAQRGRPGSQRRCLRTR